MSGVVKRPADLPALVTVNVAAAQLLRRELARVRGVGEPLDVGAELVERARVAVAHDGHDEPLLGLHGDADVVAVEIDELVALDARVQLRELAQRLRDGLQDERQQPLEVDAGEVAFLDPGDGRDLAVRARQVLEHLPLDAADRLAACLRRGCAPPRRGRRPR